jgi:hypothetical protein
MCLIIIIFLFRYARAYSGIQFFDPNLFLPPPFTFLSMLVLLVQYIDDFRRTIVKSKHERADNGSLKAGGRDLGLEDRNGGILILVFKQHFPLKMLYFNDQMYKTCMLNYFI